MFTFLRNNCHAFVVQEKNGVESIEAYSERLDRIVERNCKTGQFGEEGEDGETVPMTTGEDGQAELVASDYLQRKVYCSLCSKRFWSLQDLRRHMRSHTGEEGHPGLLDHCISVSLHRKVVWLVVSCTGT